ncbi:MAG: DsbA family protein [Nanoarchaeota archaeon]
MSEDQQPVKAENKKVTLEFSKLTLWKIISSVLFVVLIVSIFTGGFGIGKNGSPTGTTTRDLGDDNFPTGAAVVNAKQLEDDDPFLGDKNAPVVMIEFSDFQCPFCRRFWQDTLPQIKTNYIDTGKVKFVYRDFPLSSIHPGAQPAAEATECADDQGKFWEMHDKIFEEQSKQGQGTVQFGITELKKWAGEIGLDTNKFNECLDSGKYTDEVNKDLRDATSSGGQGTPYFIIGNTPVSGAQPYAAFQQVIESELS